MLQDCTPLPPASPAALSPFQGAPWQKRTVIHLLPPHTVRKGRYFLCCHTSVWCCPVESLPRCPLKGGKGRARRAWQGGAPPAPALKYHNVRSIHTLSDPRQGALERGDGPQGAPAEIQRSDFVGRGRAAERMSFRACEEANDVELVRTMARGCHKTKRTPSDHNRQSALRSPAPPA